MIQDFEIGEPVFIQWVEGTKPELVQFAGLNPKGLMGFISFFILKQRSYGYSIHEYWPDEIGIGDTPEDAEAYLKQAIDFELTEINN